MPSVKVSTDDFNITSAWKCKKIFVYHGTQNYGSYQYKFASGPSANAHSVHFDFNLPSGAKATKVQVWARIISSGASIRTANGNAFNLKSGDDVGADVTLTGNNGLDVKFVFRANGVIKQDENIHYSTAQFKNVYLWIEYEGDSSGSGGGSVTPPIDTSNDFHVPPQSVAIYNQDNGKLYMFDGVTKIQHTFSVKIEEEPDKTKHEYVNNARNQPDKVVIDALMSDVYSDSSNMTLASGWDEDAQGTAYDKAKGSIIAMQESDGSWSRSGNAVYVLRRMKEARTKLSIITPQYVHVDMLLATITINQDETCPYGWQGQIEFQHTFKPDAPKQDNNSKAKQGKTPPPSGSVASSWVTNAFNAVSSCAQNIFNNIAKDLGG